MTNIEKNYNDYLTSNSRIGFTQSFPVVEVISEMEVTNLCRNYNVTFKVQHVKVCYGKKTDVVDAVVTERVDIANRLFAGGWGQHSYIDEGEVMEKAVVEMCKQKNLMICTKICTWPFAKAIVQPNLLKN